MWLDAQQIGGMSLSFKFEIRSVNIANIKNAFSY